MLCQQGKAASRSTGLGWHHSVVEKWRRGHYFAIHFGFILLESPMKTLHGTEGFSSEMETQLIVEPVVCEQVLSDYQYNSFL